MDDEIQNWNEQGGARARVDVCAARFAFRWVAGSTYDPAYHHGKCRVCKAVFNPRDYKSMYAHDLGHTRDLPLKEFEAFLMLRGYGTRDFYPTTMGRLTLEFFGPEVKR